jgi:hypothetical protein
MGDVRRMINLLHDTVGILTNDTELAMMRKQNKLMAWSSLYE